MKLTFALIGLLFAGHTFALSCLEPKLERFVTHKFIVKAKVLDVIEEGKQGEYEVEITQYIKGNSSIKESKLHVFTWMNNPKFKKGKEYIFFSDKAEEIRTGACGMYFKGEDKKALEKIKELLKDQANGQSGKQ